MRKRGVFPTLSLHTEPPERELLVCVCREVGCVWGFFSCKVKLSPAAPAVFISHLNVYYFPGLGKQLLSVACIILKKELLS